MSESYKIAVEVRMYRLLRNVADGSVDPMDAAGFAVDEINASFGRGITVGEHTATEKRPPQEKGVILTPAIVS